MPSSKTAIKRMSLHPSVKLNPVQVIEPKGSASDNVNQEVQIANETNEDERQINGDSNQQNRIHTSDEDISKELENLDSEPKKKTSKRLSDTMPLSNKAIKRASLHPNVKLNTAQLIDTHKSNADVMDINDETETTELLQSPDEPNSNQKSCTDEVTTTKDSNANQNKMNNYDDKLARCNDYLQRVNEEKRLDKLEHKVIKTEKAQRSKEKKERKLQAKKEKKAREEKQAALAAEQLLRKKEKKEIKKKEDPIAKALAFSLKVLQDKKNQHSTELEVTDKEPNDIKSAPKKRKVEPILENVEGAKKPKIKKRKMVQILETSQPAVINTKIEDTKKQQIAAKPEGFLVQAKSTKAKKKTEKETNVERIVEVKKKLPKPKFTSTSAGDFEVQDISSTITAATKFTVTSITGGTRSTTSLFNNFKEKSLYNSKIPRESAEQLLSRKEKQRKFKS